MNNGILAPISTVSCLSSPGSYPSPRPTRKAPQVAHQAETGERQRQDLPTRDTRGQATDPF
eukprot:7067768-Alexandrium_andersonii.AAC.1